MDSDFKPMLDLFTSAMEHKLRKNSWKNPWYNCSLQYLSMRLTQEREELRKAVARGNIQQIQSEAADVANFAMMIADVCKRRRT